MMQEERLSGREEPLGNPAGQGGWGRLGRFGPGILLGVYAAVLLGTSPGAVWRLEWDSALYLLTGQALSAGEGYTHHGEPFFLRPPGLSWVISFFVRDGEVALAPLNFALRLLAAAGVAAIYQCLKGPFGRWLALGSALLTGTSVVFVDLLPWVLSDLVFLAFLFGGLGLLERGITGEKSWGSALLGAVSIAAAVLFRSTAILALPALALLPLLRRRGAKRWVGVGSAVLAGLLCVPWMLHARDAAADAPRPSEQLFLFDYSTALLRVDVGDPDSDLVPLEVWRERATSQAPALAEELTWTAWHGTPGWLQVLWGGLAAIGMGLAIRRGSGVREVYFLATALLLVLYFTFARRLVLPLVPALYLYPLLTLRVAGDQLGARIGRRGFGSAGALGVGLVLLGINLSALPRDPTHGDLVARNSPAIEPSYLVDLSTWLRENTPPDAVLFCSYAPAIEYLSGRTAYTFRYLRAPGAIKRYGVDYVVFDAPAPPAVERSARAKAAQRHAVPVRDLDYPITVLRLNKTP